VAHTCNPSYSGGRHQEDHGSKPANSSQDPISKKPITKKRRRGSTKLEALNTNPRAAKKKKKTRGLIFRILLHNILGI
jgi:hypothetical protein